MPPPCAVLTSHHAPGNSTLSLTPAIPCATQNAEARPGKLWVRGCHFAGKVGDVRRVVGWWMTLEARHVAVLLDWGIRGVVEGVR